MNTAEIPKRTDAAPQTPGFTGSIELYLGLATHWAARLRVVGTETEDLAQEGALGLIDAAQRFDPAQVDFRTFARPRVIGAIKDAIREQHPLSRGDRVSVSRMADAKSQYAEKYGREPTRRELTSQLGVEASEVEALIQLEKVQTPQSIDQFKETLSDPDVETADEIISRLSLAEALARLTDKQRRVLVLNVLMEVTQSEIGAELGVSQMQVSRIRKRALDELAGYLSIRADTT